MRYRVSKVVFKEESDARAVLSALATIIEIHHQVSVMDYYKICHINSAPDDLNWGWRNVGGALVLTDGVDIFIKLPDPVNLEHPDIKYGDVVYDDGSYISKDAIDELLKKPEKRMGDIWWEHNPRGHEVSLVPGGLGPLHGPDVHEQPPVKNELPAIWDIVIEEMHKRDEFGRKKHGGPLQGFNKRDALWDAYQEALDMVVYLRQAIFERDVASAGYPSGYLQNMPINDARAILGLKKLEHKENYDVDADEKNKTE